MGIDSRWRLRTASGVVPSAAARAAWARASAPVSNWPGTITFTSTSGASSMASERAAAATPLRNTPESASSGEASTTDRAVMYTRRPSPPARRCGIAARVAPSAGRSIRS